MFVGGLVRVGGENVVREDCYDMQMEGSPTPAAALPATEGGHPAELDEIDSEIHGLIGELKQHQERHEWMRRYAQAPREMLQQVLEQQQHDLQVSGVSPGHGQ